MWLRPITLICKSLSLYICKHTHMLKLNFLCFPSLPAFVLIVFILFCLWPDGQFLFALSVFRFVPEVISSGPAGGQLVSQFPFSREDNEVIQLYTGQQSPSAPYIHACHVVRHTQTALTHRYPDVLGCVEQKAWGKTVIQKALLFVHTHLS